MGHRGSCFDLSLSVLPMFFSKSLIVSGFTFRSLIHFEFISMFKVRRGGREEIPLIQGKEQRLLFAGAAVKRYPKSKVRETQVIW